MYDDSGVGQIVVDEIARKYRARFEKGMQLLNAIRETLKSEAAKRDIITVVKCMEANKRMFEGLARAFGKSMR